MQIKSFLSLAAAFAFLALASPVTAEVISPATEKTSDVLQDKAKKQKAEFKITGMTCNACSSKVTNNVKKVNGILNAQVSHENGNAVVEFDGSKTTMAQIQQAIKSSGFQVTEAKIRK